MTIAIAKQKGSNAVWVANAILHKAEELQSQIVPDDMELVVTRNYGLTADEKVNELVEGLAVAVVIVVALLSLGLGWREALIVAVAVPVVFGLTLAVNLLLGFTINRVTLFALILSLGLLVDDPIVDVENIARHFSLRKKATRRIVLEAVSEIRPPLITATLAVIVSFLPMFFITGMMGPYMRPMAAQRAGDHAHVDARGVHDHPVAGLPRAAAQVQCRRHREPRRARPARSGRGQAVTALQGVLSADGPFAAFPGRSVDLLDQHGPFDGRAPWGWLRCAACR